MHSLRSRVPFACALLLAGSALSGCLAGDDADVLATFYPVTFLTAEIAGDSLRVGQILKPGIEPHHWEPSPREVARIADVPVVVAQGLGFEPWLERIVVNLGDGAPAVVRVSEAVPLPDLEDLHDGDHDADQGSAGHGHGERDPHTWLDPVLMTHKTPVVAAALAQAYPQHAAAFKANAARLVERLEALHADYERRLADCETREVVVEHEAFTYLAARYDLHVHSASGLSPEAEPNAPRVAALVETAREHNLSVVFAENAADPGVMRTIADAIGGEVRVLSPLELRTPQEARAGLDYVAIMARNLDELAAAMRCA